jgi:FkbM family methyltransferase
MMISYAQNYEDVMLERALGGRRDGFYVDVGAGDPDYMSVTRWFYDQGWSGINLEPNRVFFERLVKRRPRDITLNIGAGDARGTFAFKETPVGELSTFDLAGAEEDGESREVEVAPLDDILAEHAGARQIDFLKIDVEGWEMRVLQGLDLSRFRPTILVVEAVLPGTRVESHHAWESLVTGRGYAMVHFDGLNRFYLANEKAELADAFRLPPGVFDEITPAAVVTLTHQMRLLSEAVRGLAKQMKAPFPAADDPAAADIVRSIFEIQRRLLIADSEQSRLMLASEELAAAVADGRSAADSVPGIDRALAAIQLATKTLGPCNPDQMVGTDPGD